MEELFTDNPINWVKWGIVFVVLILGYVFIVKIGIKVIYLVSWERKGNIARAKGHVIKAELIKKYRDEPLSDKWYAKYKYTVNGKTKKYHASFMGEPPEVMDLYYKNSPRRVFGVEDEHYDLFEGLVSVFITILPWILAVLAAILLKIDMPE